MSEMQQNVSKVDFTNDMSDFGKNVEKLFESIHEMSNELAGTDMNYSKYSMSGGAP